jgi:hypothetical protein
MANNDWDHTVTIEVGGEKATYARLRNARDAAVYLLENWKTAPGKTYCSAVKACTRALRGEIPESFAYAEFLSAATDAQIAFLTSMVGTTYDEFEAELEGICHESILLDAIIVPRHSGE